MTTLLPSRRGRQAAGAPRPAPSRPTPARQRDGWQRRYGRIVVVTDLVVLAWTFFSAHLLWAIDDEWRAAADPTRPAWIAFSVLLVLGWHLLLTASATRDPRILGTGPEEYKRVINATIVAAALAAFVAYVRGFVVPPAYILVALPFGLLLVVLGRWSWRQWLVVQRQRGRMGQVAVVAGHRDAVAHLAAEIGRNPGHGYRLAGVCVTGSDLPDSVAGLPVLGGLGQLLQTTRQVGADAVIVTSSDAMHPNMVRRLGWELEGTNIEMIVAPALANVAGPRVHIRPVSGLPLLHVEPPSYQGAQRWMKALLDRVGGLLLLVALSPLLLVLAACVRLTSRGPAFYRQERAGRQGRTFGMIKLRSMVVGADAMLDGMTRDAGNGVMFKMKNDPRVTRVGAFLRRYSLDELPQVINVVKGDMSLVGPRPPLLSEVDGYEVDARRRLLVRPGITGPWQVSGRSDLDWEETVRLDLYYVENWSLVGDLLILVKTVRAVLSSKGAY